MAPTITSAIPAKANSVGTSCQITQSKNPLNTSPRKISDDISLTGAYLIERAKNTDTAQEQPDFPIGRHTLLKKCKCARSNCAYQEIIKEHLCDSAGLAEYPYLHNRDSR